MAHVVVKEEVAVPPDTLWRLVADFGSVGWIPGGETARAEGTGAGMVRIFGAGSGAEIRERLESVDEAARRIVYTIPQGMPMPIKHYRATMTVHPGGQRSVLEWSCTFEPDGVAEADAKAQVENLYKMMIGWIRDYLAR
jgi:hypothetical protein